MASESSTSEPPVKKARITPLCPVPDEEKKTWFALTVDHVHHFTIWWNPKMTWGQAMKAFTDCYHKVAFAKSGEPWRFTLGDSESRLGQQNQIRAIEPVGIDPKEFALLDFLKQKYDRGNHPGPLRPHLTLFDGDDPNDFLGKKIEVTHVSIHWGKVDFSRCFTHPESGRLPTLCLTNSEEKLMARIARMQQRIAMLQEQNGIMRMELEE